MKILRIVPMFRRNREVEAYIPHLIGFTEKEEIELLYRVDRAIPRKMWAFVENSIPAEYQGVLVNQMSVRERYKDLREAHKDLIGYNFKVVMGVKELLEQCNAVAIDTQYSQFTQIMALLGVYCDDRVRTVALSVNSLKEFDEWRNQGFDFFIGDFYTKTVISDNRPAEKINPVKANQIALLAEIGTWKDNDPNQDLHKLASIIERDVALTLSILKLSNAAAFGGRGQINNVHDAIVRVGTGNLKRWAMTYLTSTVTDEKTPEIARVALLRGKFMENLAGQIGLEKWKAFFTGLASVAGVMLGISQEQALQEMNAPPEIAGFLQHADQMGAVYGVVEGYLNGNMDLLEKNLARITLGDNIYLSYLNAEMWVVDLLRQMEIK